MDDIEDRARSLLEAAGQTITVEPAGPVRPKPRPWWPVVAGAAAVLLLVIGLAAVALTRESESTPPATPTSEVRVPQTLWMTPEQAESTLDALGLRARIRGDRFRDTMAQECGLPMGRVHGSSPAPSTVVEPGATVTLTLLGASESGMSAYCAGPQRFEQDALALLDLARFAENGPHFAPSVDIWVDGELVRTLTAEEAADPDAWGDPSPLTRMLAAIDDMDQVNGKLVSPTVWSYIDKGNQLACGANDPPAALSGRKSTVVTIEHRTDGVGVRRTCHWVRVYRDESGHVDAVTSSDLPRPAGKAPPVETDVPAEPAADERAVAEDFLDFAAGGPAPGFADEVRLLLGNRLVATVPAAEATRRETWSLSCAGYAERSCPINALSYITESGTAIHGTFVRAGSACHTVFGDLPADLTTDESLAGSVSFGDAEPAACLENWEVQLWLDDSAAIRAVNLILGSP